MIRDDDWSLDLINSLLVVDLVNQPRQSPCDDFCEQFIDVLVDLFEDGLEVDDDADANEYAHHRYDLIGKPNKASDLHSSLIPMVEICSDGGTPLLLGLNVPDIAVLLNDLGHVPESEEGKRAPKDDHTIQENFLDH